MIFTEQKGQIVKDLGQVRLTLPKIEDFKTGDFPIFPWFFHGFSMVFIPYVLMVFTPVSPWQGGHFTHILDELRLSEGWDEHLDLW